MPALFHSVTLVNDFAQYAAMRASFEAAGFNDTNCRFTVFDNTDDNRHDPYQILASVCSETPEPYLLFCHQDVRMEGGHDFARLKSVLEELEAHDPNWAVAGNAGITDTLTFAVEITDPNLGVRHTDGLPLRVIALDENFLVIKTQAKVSCSPQLSGFHFYATDLCLNAWQHHHTCYVIDFHLTHLSGGSEQSADYQAVRRRFHEHWNRAFRCAYLKTPSCPLLFLSRFELVRRVFGSKVAMVLVDNYPHVYARLLHGLQALHVARK